VSGERDIVHPPELQGLKRASKALIRAAGGQEAAAAETHKSQSRFAAYGLPNTPDFMGIDTVLALEGVTHGTPAHPAVTRMLARQAGYGLVRLPDPALGETKWSALVARLAHEGGELMSGVCEDLASGNDVSREEAQRRLADAADLVRVSVEIEAALKARAEGRD
jgi:hypothetical protein